MKIESKFSVNDLVKRKTDIDPKNKMYIIQVMEVQSQTCYAGTQVFYLCRTLIFEKEYKKRFTEEGEFEWKVAHGVSVNSAQTGWTKYREDELSEAPKEAIEILKSQTAL